jgi:hypothetical protein
VRLRAAGLFKRDVDGFYSNYEKSWTVRLVASLVVAIILAGVTMIGDETELIITCVASVTAYMALILYFMWCAETARFPSKWFK